MHDKVYLRRWRQRLARAMSFPNHEQVRKFLREIPANRRWTQSVGLSERA
jgi:hypothetical protein